jgi:serine/threonine protein kinase/tetratricopeptide (TPR) repeat protein
MLDRLSAALADRYTVVRELGRGGMASVWLARDLRHDRMVAIKVLHPELAGAIGVDRFLREIRVTAKLQHPNIVPLLDSGVFPGADGVSLPWYAMAYVPGESLRARLGREAHLPVDEALCIAEDAAAALEAAHREGIVHRDIKPENLLLSGGRAYVADFGIAKAVIETGGERLTSTGLAIGTPVYMSPEQASAQAVDARSDQYGLACVLYEMLVGEPPFTGPTAQAVVARRLAEPARAIRPVRASVSAGTETAVLRALERIPADRFPDISTFARALRSTPAPDQAPARPAARPARRVLIGAVVLVVAGLAAWLVGHRPTAAPVERDPEAVALYQRGMHESAKRTPAAAVEAIRALTAAVRRDSTYTEAWAGLAKTYIRAYGRRFTIPGMAPDSILRLAVAAADRALAGNRRSAEAWKAQGIVTRNVDPTDLAPAIRSLRQALALDSSDAEAWHYLAVSLAESDDMNGALEDWRRSVAADPSYAEGLAFLALGHYWRRQYDSAARWADSAITVEPNYLLGRSTVGYIAIERGDYRRARAAFEAARRLTTDVEAINSAAGTALADARAGALREARDLLQQAESKETGYAATSLHTVVFMAQAHAAVGATDRAIAWIRRYTPSNDLHFQLHLRCDPPFDPIAADPRFRALLLAPRPAGSQGC